jgi:hypothetical protein
MRVLQSVVALLAAATLQAATHEATVSFVDGMERCFMTGMDTSGFRRS